MIAISAPRSTHARNGRVNGEWFEELAIEQPLRERKRRGIFGAEAGKLVSVCDKQQVH